MIVKRSRRDPKAQEKRKTQEMFMRYNLKKVFRGLAFFGISIFLVLGLSPTVLGEATLSITSVEDHCVLRSDGTVWCWGRNFAGQLGNGTTTDPSYTPVQVKDLSTVTKITAGALFYCALLEDGGVSCWGKNEEGQHGNGTTIKSLVPTRVVDLGQVVDVSSGLSHTCAVLANGGVRCWGRNSRGQLGDGSTNSSASPVTVKGIRTASAVQSGGRHTCALVKDGLVKCWGLNERGELGDGTGKNSRFPVLVQGLTSVVGLGGGEAHTCAIRGNSTVTCWGQNYAGQLGDGTDHWARSPVSVKDLSTATIVSHSGMAHTCALLKDKAVWCWGFNVDGQLGDGTGKDSWVPVRVKEISAVKNIGVGMLHSCASTSSTRSVWCWGSRIYVNKGFQMLSLTPLEITIPLVKEEEKKNGQPFPTSPSLDK